MNKRLAYLFVALAAVFLSAVACTDYGAQINDLQQQINALQEKGKTLGTDAEALSALVSAAQQNDQLVSFDPIAEDGVITGFKATFKDAGEVIVYNRNSNIQVGVQNGKYYWMADGQWLTDADGNKVEITPETPVPQFVVTDGVLRVSVDGGKSFKPLGNVDKCLITSVAEDAAQVVFTLSGGAVVTLPKYKALKLTLNGDDTVIGAGESITVTYEIEGAENASVQVLCGIGWRASATAATPTTGTIEITAPTPIAQDKVMVFASDGKGRMVAVEMRLTIDESTNPEPPEPPEDPVLRPVISAYTIQASGGEVIAPLLTNLEYEVETDAEWLHYQGTKAVRTDNLSFFADPNTDSERTATATITSGVYSTSITFVQEAVERYLFVSEEGLYFRPQGGVASIIVTANVPYTYNKSEDWVTITGEATEGESRFTVTVPANESFEERSAVITFTSELAGSQTVSIYQQANVRSLTVSPTDLSFNKSGGSSTVTVTSNVAYTVSSPSNGWLTVSGSPAAGTTTFTVTAQENSSFDTRMATIAFNGDGVSTRNVIVTQSGNTIAIPRAEGGVNLYTAPSSGYHYRYGPSIIRNSDGSLDVWISKEGANYLYYGEYAYQETGSRSKKSASGHTFAQYFNIQHKFRAIQLRMYGTGAASDNIVIKLYKWAGSYAATLATAPIASRTFSSISTGGNYYRTYRSDQAWMEAGEYLWTATEATSGVGIYAYPGAGTSSIIDAVSYVDGSSTNSYNYEMRPRGRTTTNYANVDRFTYFHSTDGGSTWTRERDVLFGTEGFEDEWSVCDPGAACFGGWYYIAYTSAPKRSGDLEGRFNHCYIARSRTPVGPWYKWNGRGWGGEPAKVVEFTGDTREWGCGEPSIVVKDNTIYFYHSYVEGITENNTVIKPDSRKTKVLTAPVSDDWPAHLTDRGVAIDQNSLVSSDSADVKYVEDYDMFYAFHTYYRMTSSAKIAVWTSQDGINFTFRGNLGGSIQPGVHNMGVSGDGQGHIRLSEQQYLGYAYGIGSWGLWSTWIGPLIFE